MKQADIAERLILIEERLNAIEKLLSARVPPNEVRTHIEDNMATADQVDTIVGWLGERMSGDQLQFHFDDLIFLTRQLTSILQDWRTDLLLMRSDVRRLAALSEQTAKAHAEDDEAWLRARRDRRISERRSG